MTIQVSEEIKEKAFAMWGRGDSVSKVARALFKGNWARTKKLHHEWKNAQGITEGADAAEVDGAAADGGEHEAADVDAPDLEEEPEEWDCVIKVPTARLAQIWATFTSQEKATAIQNVLQIRMDAELMSRRRKAAKKAARRRKRNAR